MCKVNISRGATPPLPPPHPSQPLYNIFIVGNLIDNCELIISNSLLPCHAPVYIVYIHLQKYRYNHFISEFVEISRGRPVGGCKYVVRRNVIIFTRERSGCVSRVTTLRQQSGSAPHSAPAALQLSHFLSHKT